MIWLTAAPRGSFYLPYGHDTHYKSLVKFTRRNHYLNEMIWSLWGGRQGACKSDHMVFALCTSAPILNSWLKMLTTAFIERAPFQGSGIRGLCNAWALLCISIWALCISFILHDLGISSQLQCIKQQTTQNMMSLFLPS